MSAVSIILPVFNRTDTLPRCIDSVLAQTFTDWELVAVDDCSTDGSIDLISSYDDPRIRILRHTVNQGPSAARNTGIRAATGKYLALLDSDDEWLPEKLARQIALLESGACDLCGCEYFAIDQNGEKRVHLPEPSSWAEYLHTTCDLGNGTTLVLRAEIVAQVGLLDDSFRFYEDWDWLLRMAQSFRYAVVHEPLARVHLPVTRSPQPVALAAEQFLRKNHALLSAKGDTYFQQIAAHHYEIVAMNAFAAREFGLGVRYLWKSVLCNPRYRPHRLAAVPLAAIDATFGTSLVCKSGELLRKLRGSHS